MSGDIFVGLTINKIDINKNGTLIAAQNSGVNFF